MRDAFRECPLNIHQKIQRQKGMHSIAQPAASELKITKYIVRKSCTLLVLQRRFVFFKLLRVVFQDRCVANPEAQINSKIIFHVCSLLVISESPFNLNCTKNASNIATRNQETFFKKLFQGYWRCPALLKNQSGQLPGPSNLPRSWKKLKSI